MSKNNEIKDFSDFNKKREHFIKEVKKNILLLESNELITKEINDYLENFKEIFFIDNISITPKKTITDYTEAFIELTTKENIFCSITNINNNNITLKIRYIENYNIFIEKPFLHETKTIKEIAILQTLEKYLNTKYSQITEKDDWNTEHTHLAIDNNNQSFHIILHKSYENDD